MSLRRTHVSLLQNILAPRSISVAGPVCMTCGRVVDSEQLVDGEPGRTTFAKVLVKHHGQEELRTFDFGSVEWDSDMLKSHMSRGNWFDPRGEGDAGLGVKIQPDYVSDPETKRIWSDGGAK